MVTTGFNTLIGCARVAIVARCALRLTRSSGAANAGGGADPRRRAGDFSLERYYAADTVVAGRGQACAGCRWALVVARAGAGAGVVRA